MDKKQRKNRESIATIIITIILIITFSFFIIDNYQIIKTNLTINKNLNIELSKLKNNYNRIKNNEKEIVNDINKLKDIDEEITKSKTEVLNLASQLENKISNGEANAKIAYITFDDGPYYATNTVLDILKRYQVKATFFTIGLNKDICYDNKNYSCYEMYKKIVDNGHTIANHTYSHLIRKGLYSSPNSFIEQVKLQENLIENRTGIKTNIIRFPGGSATAKSLTGDGINDIMSKLKENGYGWVDWTAQDGDGGYLPNYNTAWNNFTNSINENIEVILFHDYSNITIQMLPSAIEYLENNGYIILPLFYESIKVNK